MKINLIKIRIILWHFLAFIVVFLVYMSIVPSGHISYIYNFNKDSSFISKISPKERVQLSDNGSQKIIGDPVYFSLRTTRNFNKASLEIKYKNSNPEKNPIIETGILVDGDLWRYKLKPLDNYLLDDLSNDWSVLREGDNCLFINTKKASSSYDSIDSFLKNPPPSNKIATYNYDLNLNYFLDNYSSSSKEYDFEYDLRGDYQFFTYIDNEDLFFSFDFADINRNKDIDPIDLYLYYNNQIIDSKHLDDDGIINDRGTKSDLRNITFDLVNMPRGAYKIELRAGDDIITKNIRTKQNMISFLNKLWIAGSLDDGFSLFTDSDIFHVQTTNPASKQALSFSSSTLQITETFKQYSHDLVSSTTEIEFERGDVIVAGNGVFSFEREALLNPRIKKIDNNFNIAESNLNYIIAKYRKPERKDDYYISNLDFDLAGVYRENSKYSFIISIPGLKLDDGIDDYLEVSEIKVDLFGLGLKDKIKSLFR